MVTSTKLLLLFFLSLKSGLVVLYNDSGVTQYYGEKFPTKYLTPEETLPKMEDLKLYVRSLKRTVHYFNRRPNKTDGNVALGAYFTKAVLKRSLRDYTVSLPQHEQRLIKDIIEGCENLVSHFVYSNNPNGFDDIHFRVSRPFKYDDAQIYSIGEFKRGRMNRWIYSNIRMNDYAEEMDEMTFSRLKYVEVTTRPSENYINADDSDLCLSRIVYELEPINLSDLKPCKPDKFCLNRLHSSPSVSYNLSHRLLNIMMRRHLRRCYLRSPAEDQSLMDLLCAFMYRETVYLARRGFFARDIFLEHIALCALLGYEEFHRRQWFSKVMSWIDDQGCVQENPNYRYNLTDSMIKYKTRSVNEVDRMQKNLRRRLLDKCHHHPMALATIVMAHGIRYATFHKSLNLNGNKIDF